MALKKEMRLAFVSFSLPALDVQADLAEMHGVDTLSSIVGAMAWW